MRIISKTGREDIAFVYVAETKEKKLVEFVESVQPPIPRSKKWVIIISTLYGCPVKCSFCDAGGFYYGKVSESDMLNQIDFAVQNRFNGNDIPVEKFKIQFARMGEPAYNSDVIKVLEKLPEIYNAPGLIPSVSTIAPKNSEKFLNDLSDVIEEKYKKNFQMQFSIHTTDIKKRDNLIPVKKMSFREISKFGEGMYHNGGRKITLNFALAEGMPIETSVLLDNFDPDKFLIKITPVNPTLSSMKSGIKSVLREDDQIGIDIKLRKAGYDVILSIGELEENMIGSNCGQYITNYKNSGEIIEKGYTYSSEEFCR